MLLLNKICQCKCEKVASLLLSTMSFEQWPRTIQYTVNIVSIQSSIFTGNSQDEVLPLRRLKCNQQILTGQHSFAIQSTISYVSVTLLLTEYKSIIFWLCMLKSATSSCTVTIFLLHNIDISKSFSNTDLYIKYNVSHHTYVDQYVSKYDFDTFCL